MYYAKALCPLNFESCSTDSLAGFILKRFRRDVRVEFWDAHEQPANIRFLPRNGLNPL